MNLNIAADMRVSLWKKEELTFGFLTFLSEFLWRKQKAVDLLWSEVELFHLLLYSHCSLRPNPKLHLP